MDFDELKVDQKLATEGVWVPFVDGADILIGRAHVSNPKFREVSRRIYGEKKMADMTAAEQREANIALYAEAVILGWRGFTRGGEPFDYSVENAIAVLDEHEDEMFPFLHHHATRRETFRAKRVEATTGN